MLVTHAITPMLISLIYAALPFRRRAMPLIISKMPLIY